MKCFNASNWHITDFLSIIIAASVVTLVGSSLGWLFAQLAAMFGIID